MKRRTSEWLVWLSLLLCVTLVCCTDSKRPGAGAASSNSSGEQQDSVAVDSVADIVEDAPLSKAVDELFDDFFFNFAGNRRMQMSRIAFPLTVDDHGETTQMEGRDWHYTHFFMGEGFYTILLDNVEQDSLSKSYSLQHASVEKLFLNDGRMERYDFDRKTEGEWFLTKLERGKWSENHPCASFLEFYQQFSSDTTFQVKSLDDFVVMTAPDSEDEEFNDLTGSIMPDQWSAFKPEVIPSGVVYCVNYGQHYSDASRKVLIVRGVANGLSIEMDFRRKGDNWKLVGFKV